MDKRKQKHLIIILGGAATCAAIVLGMGWRWIRDYQQAVEIQKQTYPQFNQKPAQAK